MKCFDLSSRVALVTGGAGWLGSAMSEGLAEAGAKVVIADYNQSRIDQVLSDLQQKDLPVSGLCADLTEDKQLRDTIDKTYRDMGKIDILVNCAYAGPTPELDEITFEEFDLALHNGVSSYGIAAQQAAKFMRKQGGGNIINIGSMYGMVSGYPEVYEGITKPTSVVYQAGKAGVIQMTRYMAVFWAKDNIRVNCISPGPFLQHDRPQEMPEFTRRLAERVPLGRIGRADELKGAVIFLGSDASSYVTGQNIVVDGGWTVW